MSLLKLLISLALATTTFAASPYELCQDVCPRHWHPVCGRDNSGRIKIFDNKCKFNYEACKNRKESWRIIGLDHCFIDSSGFHCNHACPQDYKPVCGEDGNGNFQAFRNKCIFDFTWCKNRSANWKEVSIEQCPHLHLEHKLTKRNTISAEPETKCDNRIDHVCGINTKSLLFGIFQNLCQLRQKQNEEGGWIKANTTVENCADYFYQTILPQKSQSGINKQ